MKKISLFYILMLVAVSAAIAGLLQLGSSLPVPQSASVEIHEKAVTAREQTSAFFGFVEGLRSNVDHPLSHLFIQLLVIVSVSRAVGKIFARLGQPEVIGEMVAGILLGPSLFGFLAPELFAAVFPKESLGTLRLLSQIGVCLFMFVVGMELDLQHVKSKVQAAECV